MSSEHAPLPAPGLAEVSFSAQGHTLQLLVDQGLREHYGLERDEVMAFGDADNDREMLLHAGWPVAMQNGTESMKSIARIIAPDCNDSGVGRVIEEYVLSGRIK